MTDLYSERAALVAALSKLFPASLESDPEQPDWPVCIIDLPTGQVSWHIAQSDLHLFMHLPRETGRVWDGHTTPEKYDRLNALYEPLKLSHSGRVMASLNPAMALIIEAQERDFQEAQAASAAKRQKIREDSDARMDRLRSRW
ncbi:hypothetical protein ACFFLM_04520 [Deinococcus oregonensis]|uniref:WDGH domain-containing protein n=1 Tax=Deinococcus oregonensis TaxID=1805970 RepID=A0ABV6AUR7_9DEIO